MSEQKFIATHGEQTRELKVTALGDGRYAVTIDGVSRQVDARRFAGGTWSLLIDQESFDVELEVAGPTESAGQYNSLVRGQVVRLTVRDERHARMGAQQKLEVRGPQVLVSPMPGKVVKLLATVGQEVVEGQALVIVEAMKMENELRAPKSGRVGQVFVSEGQNVEHRAKLVSVE
jgi:biotin carboxyl carrier protein